MAADPEGAERLARRDQIINERIAESIEDAEGQRASSYMSRMYARVAEPRQPHAPHTAGGQAGRPPPHTASAQTREHLEFGSWRC